MMYSNEVPEELRRFVEGAFPDGVDSNVLMDIWRHFSARLPPHAALSHETLKKKMLLAIMASVPGAGASAPPVLPTFALRFTHKCTALACRMPSCLCNSDALQECGSPFDDKYIMSWSELHCLRAPCGAKICVTVTQDGVGEGGAAWDAFKQSFPGATLQMCLLPAGHYQTHVTERGAMDWDTVGALGTLLTDRPPPVKKRKKTSSTTTTATARQTPPRVPRPVLMRHDGLPESSDGFVPFQPGLGSEPRPIPEVSFRASGEILAKALGCALAKKMPPLDLVVRAVDARGCPLDSRIRPAVSERPESPQERPSEPKKGTFVVVTERSKGAVKAKVPHVHMDVMKVVHIGEKVRDRLHARGVETVGELLELLDGVKAKPSHAEELRKELCMDNAKWEAMIGHAGTAVQPDDRCPMCCAEGVKKVVVSGINTRAAVSSPQHLNVTGRAEREVSSPERSLYTPYGEAVTSAARLSRKGAVHAWPQEHPHRVLPPNFAPDHNGAAMFHSFHTSPEDPLMAVALDTATEVAGVARAGQLTPAPGSGQDAPGGKVAQDSSPDFDAVLDALAPMTPSPAGHSAATGLCGYPQNWGMMLSSPFERESKRKRTALTPGPRATAAHPDASPTSEYVAKSDVDAANQENGAPAVNTQDRDGYTQQALGGLLPVELLDLSMDPDTLDQLISFIDSDASFHFSDIDMHDSR